MKKKILIFTLLTGLLLTFGSLFTVSAESSYQKVAPSCIIMDQDLGCWSPPASQLPPAIPSGTANLRTTGNTTIFQSFHSARRHRVLATVNGHTAFGPDAAAGQPSMLSRSHPIGATVSAGIQLR